MSLITASKPFSVRRYGSGRYHKAEYYYDRMIYAAGKPIGIWENWACCWKLDWSYYRRGIFITSIYRPDHPDMYADGECPEWMRLPTEDEQAQYLQRMRALSEKRSKWKNEHPYQAWMRQREAEAAAQGKEFDAYQDFLENG